MPDDDLPPPRPPRTSGSRTVLADGGRRARRRRSAPARSRWPRRSPPRSSGGEHLLVQAGTGTGKSLAYLVPALLAPHGGSWSPPRPSPCSTSWSSATCPGWSTRSRATPGRRHVVRRAQGPAATTSACTGSASGVPDEQGVLVDVPDGSMGKQVLELRAWAEEEAEDKSTGDRDELRPGTPTGSGGRSRSAPASAWARRGARSARSASPSAPGARAPRRSVVVTNHALLAIDAHRGHPDAAGVRRRGRRRGARAVDRAITQAATDELSVQRRRAGGPAGPAATSTVDQADDLDDAAGALAGRARRRRRRPARPGPGRPGRRAACWSATPPAPASAAMPKEGDAEADAGRSQARAGVQEVFDHAERMAADLRVRRALAQRPRAARGGPQLCVRAAAGRGARCATSCSPTRRWCSPARR